jgi:NTP pyrophosphatase (non-canonical NTP hydrolase)
MDGDIQSLITALRKFDAERNGWRDAHAPRSLVLALCSEVGELAHIFRWQDETDIDITAVNDEVADILIFLLLLCDRLSIDPIQAATEKVARNAIRYPPADPPVSPVP